MYNETLRPQFHFSARENWINDPNGLVYYNGLYHLFFQHNPAGLQWGNMTWGHAVSRDMLRWTQLENKLAPDEMGTMFSGSAVVDWHNTSGLQQGEHPPIVLMYTAAGGTSPESEGKRFTQCLAYSIDGGIQWTKYSGNPVLDCLRDGNRDPKVVWHAPSRNWIMTLYLDGNDFALFSSTDLKAWSHLQDITAPESIECPDFFELPVLGKTGESRWVWVAGNGRYYVGGFDGEYFAIESDLLTGDWGANFYACQTFSDISDGRRIQMSWMRDGAYPGMPFNQQMSLPCELQLRRTPQGLRLSRWPIQEIGQLVSRRHEVGSKTLNDSAIDLPALSGGLYDITCTLEIESAKAAGVVVHGIPITFHAQTRSIECLGCSAPVSSQSNIVTLRILVDRASIEVFAEDGLVSMTSCYLPVDGAAQIRLFSQGGSARFTSLAIAELKSIWPMGDGDKL